jgi:tetraacyldisaccharide 4'-kinase
VLTADLVPGPEIAPLRGKKLFAFAGIGRPAKFFDMLTSAGLRLAGAIPFPDHHVFTAEDFDKILRQAAAAGATPVTTAKDLARMPPARRGAFVAVTVSLAWHDAAALARLLAEACR